MVTVMSLMSIEQSQKGLPVLGDIWSLIAVSGHWACEVIYAGGLASIAAPAIKTAGQVCSTLVVLCCVTDHSSMAPGLT